MDMNMPPNTEITFCGILSLNNTLFQTAAYLRRTGNNLTWFLSLGFIDELTIILCTIFTIRQSTGYSSRLYSFAAS